MSNNILIVDDEESIRYTFKSFLAEEGHSVSIAKDYDEAIKLISENSYDLIFADIILGGRTGIELLKEVRKTHPVCPVVMITGYPNIETATDAVRLGAFDYIPKPVKPDVLIHITSMALKHKALQDENEKIRSNLEAIFSSVRDAIITVDRDLRIIEANNAASKFCSIKRDHIGGSFESTIGNCSGVCSRLIRETVNTRQPAEMMRVECNRHDGIAQVVSITVSPLLNSNDSFAGAVMIVRDETRLSNLERDLQERKAFHHIIGQNEKMQRIYTLIEDLADVQTTVLITGESGTGKELVAEAIHYSGVRSSGPLVKVNCSALSENLLESELFGHVKGAFTGADRDKTGRFQKADGGTIFLDEIGDISERMQIRLLRVLQENVFERVGDSSPIKVDVRIIAATNKDLHQKVKKGEFREDLYYRLRVVEIFMPPLRDRRDDIPLLLEHFIDKYNKRLGRNISSVSSDAMKILMEYKWHGNIRELEHAIEHAFIICHQDMIMAAHLPEYILHSPGSQILTEQQHPVDKGTVIAALKKAGWNKSKAARFLGVNVRTIYRKIEKYGIREED